MEQWVFLSAYILLFIVICQKCKFFTFRYFAKYWVYILFGIHLAAGVGFYGVYHYHYPSGLDSEASFHSGTKLFNTLYSQPNTFAKLMLGYTDSTTTAAGTAINKSWVKQYESNTINENRTVLRVNALLNSFSGQHYSVHLLLMIILAFCGSFFLFHFFAPENKQEEKVCILACFLIPSCLFWTSGVLKEPLFFFCMSCYLYFLQKITSKISVTYILLAIMAALGMIWTRTFIALVLIPLSMIYIWCAWRPQHQALKYIGAVILGGIMITVIHSTAPGSALDLVNNIAHKNQLFINMENVLFDGLDMNVPHVKASTANLIYNAPFALYNTMFIPCKLKSALHIGIFMENIFFGLLLFLSLSMVLIRKTPYSNKQWLLLLFCIICFTVIGLTTPNAGAICRYRCVLLPLWCYTLCMPLCRK